MGSAAVVGERREGKKMLLQKLCLSGVAGLALCLAGALYGAERVYRIGALCGSLCAVLLCLLIRGRANRQFRRGIYLFAAVQCVLCAWPELAFLLLGITLSVSELLAGIVVMLLVPVALLVEGLVAILPLVSILAGALREKGVYRWLAVVAGVELTLLVVGIAGISTPFVDLIPFVYRYGPPVLSAALGIFAFLYLGPQPPETETQASIEMTKAP